MTALPPLAHPPMRDAGPREAPVSTPQVALGPLAAAAAPVHALAARGPSLRRKLFLAFGLVSALGTGNALIGYFAFQQVAANQSAIDRVAVPALVAAQNLSQASAQLAAIAPALAAATQETERQHQTALTATIAGQMEQALDWMAASGIAPAAVADTRALTQRTHINLERISVLAARRLELVAARDQQQMAARRAFERLNALTQPAITRLNGQVMDLGSEVIAALHGRNAGPDTSTLVETLIDRDVALLQRLFQLRQAATQVMGQLDGAAGADTRLALGGFQAGFQITQGYLQNQNTIPDPPLRDALLAATDILSRTGNGDDSLFEHQRAILVLQDALSGILDENRTAGDAIGQQVATLVQAARDAVTQADQTASGTITKGLLLQLAFGLLGLVATAMIARRYVDRDIIARLAALQRSMAALAGGNLDAPMPSGGRDEIARMTEHLMSFRDTARLMRTTEQAYAQARAEEARAEAASRAKSEFLARMSHELRTPLNAIIGYAEMVQEDLDPDEQARLGPDLERIGAAGAHLLELINDVLDLSKIEAGRMEIDRQQFALEPLVRHVMALVEPMALRNHNRLTLSCPAVLGEMESDATKIRQCLINLLSNACKFTENGTVSLIVETAENGEMLTLAVRDTGIGMTEDQLARLFQPFAQADASMTRRFGGTGLGLMIARSFAQLLGGEIAVSSRHGIGSTFVMSLPRRCPAAPSLPAPVAGITVALT